MSRLVRNLKEVYKFRVLVQNLVSRNRGVGISKRDARELDDQVISDHISLFVNEFTLSLGQTGMRAIEALEERARCQGIL